MNKLTPESPSIRQVAKSMGCTHAAISNALRDGRLKSLSADDLEEWSKGRRVSRGGRRPKVAPTDLEAETAASDDLEAAAKTALKEHGLFATRAEAELHRDSYIARLRQLQYSVQAGTLVESDRVAAAVGAEYSRVRQRLLAIPAEQSPALFQAKSVVELQDALLAVITEALENLTLDGADAR